MAEGEVHSQPAGGNSGYSDESGGPGAGYRYAGPGTTIAPPQDVPRSSLEGGVGRSRQPDRPGCQPAAVGARQPLVALPLGALVEGAVGAAILCIVHWFEEVLFAVRAHRLLGLLGVEAGPGQVVIESSRDHLVAHYSLHGGPTEPQLITVVVGGPVDRLGRHLGLEDRGNRLRVVWQAALDPPELRRVDCRQLYHGKPDVATVVDQLAPQRLGEALDRVLGAAVGRLQRYRPVGECRSYLDDMALIPGEHPLQGSQGAIDGTEI